MTDFLSSTVFEYVTNELKIDFKKTYTLGTPSLSVAVKRNMRVMFDRGCGLYFSTLYFTDYLLANKVLDHIDSRLSEFKYYQQRSRDDSILFFRSLGYK